MSAEPTTRSEPADEALARSTPAPAAGAPPAGPPPADTVENLENQDNGEHGENGENGENGESERAFLDRVKREIDEEVRRRRAAGDFPPSFERHLDALFARFTPTGVHDDHFTDALKLADRAAYFDIHVPLGSRRRPPGFAKWVLWHMQAWFTGYVVAKLNTFSSAVMQVVHLLDERMSENERDLEMLVSPALPDDDAAAIAAGTTPGAQPADFADTVLGLLGDPGQLAGRVLHAECGDGALLGALAKAGFDAYGIDPGTSASDRAATSGLDVRRDDTIGHLGAVGDGKLAGLVLSGCVDRMTVSERRRLLLLAEAKVAPGGTVCVIGTAPARWLGAVGPVVADLAPERPWHAPTWSYLLGQLGFSELAVHDGPTPDALAPVVAPADHPGEAVGESERAVLDTVRTVNAVLARLEPVVGGPVELRRQLPQAQVKARPDRIDQVVPSLGAGDAIGTHVVLLRRLLQGLGYESDIWCQGSFPETRHLAHYVADLGDRPRSSAWWLYHLSSGSPVAEQMAARPEPKILDYHNITPGGLFGPWVPWATAEAEAGQRQLELISGVAFFSVADSGFNERAVLDGGFDPARSRVAPPLFDLDRAGGGAGPDPELRQRLGEERAVGGTDWLFVGRVTPSKAQHDVIKAFACYRRFFDPRARLHLVGTSMGEDYRRALERFSVRLGLAGAVRFTGAIGDQALVAHYQAADVFVCASEHEGFGIPVVEAMHHGVPVVAYAAGAVPETAGDGALLLDSKSPMAVATAANRVVDDADVRTRLVGAGRERAAAFSLERSRERWTEVMAEAVAAADAGEQRAGPPVPGRGGACDGRAAPRATARAQL